MKTNIESIFEQVSSFSEQLTKEDSVRQFADSARLLELRLKQKNVGDIVWLDEGGRYLRMDMADVLYWFMVVCGKNGICLDCLTTDILNKLRLEMERAGVSMLVMKPTIVNEDNTGEVK